MQASSSTSSSLAPPPPNLQHRSASFHHPPRPQHQHARGWSRSRNATDDSTLSAESSGSTWVSSPNSPHSTQSSTSAPSSPSPHQVTMPFNVRRASAQCKQMTGYVSFADVEGLGGEPVPVGNEDDDESLKSHESRTGGQGRPQWPGWLKGRSWSFV